MALIYARTRLGAAALGLALSVSACTVHETQVPALTGPSGLGNSVVVGVSPNVLSWDGVSQSLVTITATNSVGQPAPNVPMRVDITVDGVVSDFGRLSAKNIVTDGTGHATVTYTAPARPDSSVVINNGKKVDIQVTPTDSTFNNNFDNTTPRTASILLMPAGIIPGPPSPDVPSFVAPALNVGDPGVFSAKVVDATGVDITNQIGSFQWNFGDGATANGQTVTHTFTRIGTFPVTLTITDAIGRTNFVTQSMTIGQGQLPTATFVTSPASPVVNQTINFNASGSQAAPGHNISSFDWTFGDGTGANGAIVTHAYTTAGNYTVTLQTTDDAGRKSTLASQTINVTTGVPVAQITVSPPSGTAPVTINFIGSQSTVAPGRTIVSYHWDFGDGTTGSGPTTSHPYTKAGTYTVTLVVTDDQGNSGIATATVTIS